MTTAHPFTWSDRFLLGHHSIDATHVEFVECVEALLNADGAAIPGALDAFIRHAEAHFQQENDWLGAPDFPGGGESLNRFFARVRSALEAIADRHAGERVLVVTHGRVLDMAHRLASPLPLSQRRNFAIGNATVNWMSRERSQWKIEAWDRRGHLEAALDELPG